MKNISDLGLFLPRLGFSPNVPRYTPSYLRAMIAQHGGPLLLLDTQIVRDQYRRLKAALGDVVLHYAIKPLPHAAVVATLRDEGAHFDLATSGEVNLVKSVQVDPTRCIHTHPIKTDREIRAALDFGVTTFVVDNPFEVEKFIPYRERVNLLVRVSFRSSDAAVDLSKKFGCQPEDVLSLIAKAAAWGIRVAGLSFHVGSQTANPRKYVEAIERCCELMAAADEVNYRMTVLDIGGGFPVAYDEPVLTIEDFCKPIRAALAKVPDFIRIIAEPGRYLCAPAMTAVASVMGKAERGDRIWYYLDDGVYGSYSGLLFEGTKPALEFVTHADPNTLFNSVLAGPTCDSIDVIRENIALPALEVGDLVVGHMMGAYTAATATDFNFFPRAQIVQVNPVALRATA